MFFLKFTPKGQTNIAIKRCPKVYKATQFEQSIKVSNYSPRHLYMYILVMEHFRVVISHESLVFSWYTHSPKGLCVYQENTSDKRDILWYTTRKCCVTILYHDIENTVANTINATYQ